MVESSLALERYDQAENFALQRVTMLERLFGKEDDRTLEAMQAVHRVHEYRTAAARQDSATP